MKKEIGISVKNPLGMKAQLLNRFEGMPEELKTGLLKKAEMICANKSMLDNHGEKFTEELKGPEVQPEFTGEELVMTALALMMTAEMEANRKAMEQEGKSECCGGCEQ